jgi:excisionase family DNA binding protein
MTLDEVARHCYLSRRTVERLVSRDELPTLRIGGSVRVDPARLEEWLSERRTSREGGGQ